MLNRLLKLFGRRLVSADDYEWLQQYRYQYERANQEAARDVVASFCGGSPSGDVGVTEKWDARAYLKRLREERAASAKFFDLEADPVAVTDEESDAEKFRVRPA